LLGFRSATKRRRRAARYRALATLLGGGIPLPAALARLATEAPPRHTPASASAATLLLEFLRVDGCAPDDEVEPRIVEAADRTGDLATTLQQLAADLDAQLAARAEVVRRSVYPLFLLHATVPAATTPTLLQHPGRFFATIFAATALLWMLLLLGAFAWRSITTSPTGARRLDRVPLLGAPRRLAARARWLRLVATLHGVGINPIEALATASHSLGEAPPSGEYAAAATRIRAGGSFEDALSELRGLGLEERAELTSAAAVGDLERALRRVAERVTEQWQAATRMVARIASATVYGIAVVVVAVTVISTYAHYLDQMYGGRR
jgi:type II secretory pathway component PulF